MRALLAGFGGIGSNVYWPELKKLGYEVTVLDAFTDNAAYRDVEQVDEAFDLAVICTPNFTHNSIATKLAQTGTKRIFVEKPGVVDAFSWGDLCSTYPGTQFHLVKNNLYRKSYGELFEQMEDREVIGIDISWLNNNRIPSPGSWFTNKATAFGGISRDLMPHLYCFAVKIFGENAVRNTNFNQNSYQRWDMTSISSTDYGIVHSDGVYNVDDTAIATANINNISLKLIASWKEGYDKQSIIVFFRDGTTYEWSFGLCPAEAYGEMLKDTSNSYKLDIEIHNFLERFDD